MEYSQNELGHKKIPADKSHDRAMQASSLSFCNGFVVVTGGNRKCFFLVIAAGGDSHTEAPYNLNCRSYFTSRCQI